MVMIAYSSSIASAGLAERISAAMPAAAGAAALVPWKPVNPVTVVSTSSGAARSGFWRSSGDASGVPLASKKCVTGPRELKASGVCGVLKSDAATARAPRAEAASGPIDPAFDECSIASGGPLTYAMYFMNGLAAPETRRIAIPSGRGAAPAVAVTNSSGRPVSALSSVELSTSV